MLYHDHAQSLYVEHKLPRCTSCSGTLAYSAKTPKQIYLSTAGKGLSMTDDVNGTNTPAQVPVENVSGINKLNNNVTASRHNSEDDNNTSNDTLTDLFLVRNPQTTAYEMWKESAIKR